MDNILVWVDTPNILYNNKKVTQGCMQGFVPGGVQGTNKVPSAELFE